MLVPPWQQRIFTLCNGEYSAMTLQALQERNSTSVGWQWYANLTGLGDLVPRAMQLSALKKIISYT